MVIKYGEEFVPMQSELKVAAIASAGTESGGGS